jgi:tetratricopeptide (TPR) repeat protein
MKKTKTAPEVRPAAAGILAPVKAPWWPLLALIGLALAAYLPAMSGPFLFDDLSLPILSGQPPAPWTFFAQRVARALFHISLLADYHAWGLNPAPFHWVNWLLHAANGLLVFAILRGFGFPHWLGVFGAGVFLLHPLQTEAVSYIASRSEGLSVLFSYAALALFVRRDRAAPVAWLRALAILLLMGLAAVSKESAVAMAGVFLLADLLEGGFRRAFSNWKLYAPLLAGGAAAAAFLIRLASREGSAGFGLQGVRPLDYLWTQFQVIPLYLRFYLFPWGQNLDHAYPLAKAPGDPLSWAGLAFLAALVYLSFRYRAGNPLLPLGLLVFLALLTPTSSIIPIADTLVERRLYLPMIGLLLASLTLLERVRWNHPRAIGLGAILLAFAGLTAVRNQVYTSAIAMWQDSLAGNPKNARAHFQLAYALYQEGRCAEANRHYEQVAALEKPEYELLIDWALSLDCAGDAGAAAEKLRAATALKKDSHAWATLGMVYGKAGRAAEALEALNQALALNAGDANARAYRGNVHLVAGRIPEAVSDFEAALRIAPGNTVAAQGLASAKAAQMAPK